MRPISLLVIGLIVELSVGGVAGFGAGISSATPMMIASTVEVVRIQPVTLTTEVVRTQM